MLIPRITEHDEPGPGWSPVVDAKGERLKPIIKCRCGWWTGIGLHHVHADGRVTASYFHSAECDPGRGCGFHEFIELADYDQGDWPPSASAAGGKP